MLSYDWLKNNVLYVNITKSSDNEYRSYTIGPTNKDDYYRYRFNKKKVEYFNIRLAYILYLITKSKVYRENVENDINIEKLILVDTRKLKELDKLYSSSLRIKDFQKFVNLNANMQTIISYSKAISLFVWITTSFFNLNSICSDIFRIYKENYITYKDYFLVQGVNDIYRDEILLYILLSFPDYIEDTKISTNTIEMIYNNLINEYENIYTQSTKDNLYEDYQYYKKDFECYTSGEIALANNIDSDNDKINIYINISSFSNFEEKDYIDYYSLIFELFFLDSSEELCTKYRNDKKLCSLAYTSPEIIDEIKSFTNADNYVNYTRIIEEHETSHKTFYCINNELKNKIEEIILKYKDKINQQNLILDLSKINIQNALK